MEQDAKRKLSRKQRQTAKRKANKLRSFAEKESYRWVEGMEEIAAQFARIETQFSGLKNDDILEKANNLATRIVHVFDAEADIAEVFDKVRDREGTGLLVRAEERSMCK